MVAVLVAFKTSEFLKFETDEDKANFHSLRDTFICNLASSGAHTKLAKELARNSTITLTMDRYSHVGLFDMNAALQAMPGMSETVAIVGHQLRATGTESTLVAPKTAQLRSSHWFQPPLAARTTAYRNR